jgi:hypothetical protein
MFKNINTINSYKIAVAMSTIILVMSFNSLMCLYRGTKLTPNLVDKLSIGRQVQPSRGNKLREMQRASYILNAKVE